MGVKSGEKLVDVEDAISCVNKKVCNEGTVLVTVCVVVTFELTGTKTLMSLVTVATVLKGVKAVEKVGVWDVEVKTNVVVVKNNTALVLVRVVVRSTVTVISVVPDSLHVMVDRISDVERPDVIVAVIEKVRVTVDRVDDTAVRVRVTIFVKVSTNWMELVWVTVTGTVTVVREVVVKNVVWVVVTVQTVTNLSFTVLVSVVFFKGQHCSATFGSVFTDWICKRSKKTATVKGTIIIRGCQGDPIGWSVYCQLLAYCWRQ